MKEYLLEISQVLSEKKSSENGLTTAEAQSRLEEFGQNKLKEGKKKSIDYI